MIILERSVCKEQCQEVRDFILADMQRRPTAPVGSTAVQRVEHSKLVLSYVIMVDSTPVAWLYLQRRRGWVAWEIHQAWVCPALRGRGLATQLYRAAVNVDGIILGSGATQSKSSRALWLSFIKNSTFNIWAQDLNALTKTGGVAVLDGELQCALTVYQKCASGSDVRLLAIRK